MQICATKSEIRRPAGSNLADKGAIRRHPVIPGGTPILNSLRDFSRTGSIVDSTIPETPVSHLTTVRATPFSCLPCRGKFLGTRAIYIFTFDRTMASDSVKGFVEPASIINYVNVLRDLILPSSSLGGSWTHCACSRMVNSLLYP